MLVLLALETVYYVNQMVSVDNGILNFLTVASGLLKTPRIFSNMNYISTGIKRELTGEDVAVVPLLPNIR